jgi:hypothetical protein
MKTYADRKIFTNQEIEIWYLAVGIVDRVVHHDDCRCHELARAAYRVILDKLPAATLIVEDGKVGPVEHSWIRIAPAGTVLDVYRPGTKPSVLLIDSLVANEYKIGLPRIDIRESTINQIVYEMRR